MHSPITDDFNRPATKSNARLALFGVKLFAFTTFVGAGYAMMLDQKFVSILCFTAACVASYRAGVMRGGAIQQAFHAKQMALVEGSLDRMQESAQQLRTRTEARLDPLAIPPHDGPKNSIH